MKKSSEMIGPQFAQALLRHPDTLLDSASSLLLNEAAPKGRLSEIGLSPEILCDAIQRLSKDPIYDAQETLTRFVSALVSASIDVSDQEPIAKLLGRLSETADKDLPCLLDFSQYHRTQELLGDTSAPIARLWLQCPASGFDPEAGWEQIQFRPEIFEPHLDHHYLIASLSDSLNFASSFDAKSMPASFLRLILDGAVRHKSEADGLDLCERVLDPALPADSRSTLLDWTIQSLAQRGQVDHGMQLLSGWLACLETSPPGAAARPGKEGAAKDHASLEVLAAHAPHLNVEFLPSSVGDKGCYIHRPHIGSISLHPMGAQRPYSLAAIAVCFAQEEPMLAALKAKLSPEAIASVSHESAALRGLHEAHQRQSAGALSPQEAEAMCEAALISLSMKPTTAPLPRGRVLKV